MLVSPRARLSENLGHRLECSKHTKFHGTTAQLKGKFELFTKLPKNGKPTRNQPMETLAILCAVAQRYIMLLHILPTHSQSIYITSCCLGPSDNCCCSPLLSLHPIHWSQIKARPFALKAPTQRLLDEWFLAHGLHAYIQSITNTVRIIPRKFVIQLANHKKL